MGNDMVKGEEFPSDFLWGCATASYQIEGATEEDGRGKSIWDEFCGQTGKIVDASDGSIACDSYHRFADDISLMKLLNVGAYRFSIAWPRIQPGGTGKPNQKGLDYYSRLVDSLLANGIEPWVTLYHWDLPQALEESGGWPERDTAYRFQEYAEIMYKELGTRVRHWASLNEPWCSAFLGYRDGEHAPGKRDEKLAIRAAHHLLLAHGLAAGSFKSCGMAGEFGIVVNPSTPRPATRKPADIQAAYRASLERTALWLDPLFGRGYPEDYRAAIKATIPIKPGDMDLISNPPDFIGINYYSEDAVIGVPPSDKNRLGVIFAPTWQEKSEMGWDVVPQGLHRLLKFITREWSPAALYITENGAAFSDNATDTERIHDPRRVNYLQGHINACIEALSDGVPLKGYFAWTLMDNFEWSFGYSRKFGLVSVDPHTLARTPKDSFYYYRDVIAGYKA